MRPRAWRPATLWEERQIGSELPFRREPTDERRRGRFPHWFGNAAGLEKVSAELLELG